MCASPPTSRTDHYCQSRFFKHNARCVNFASRTSRVLHKACTAVLHCSLFFLQNARVSTNANPRPCPTLIPAISTTVYGPSQWYRRQRRRKRKRWKRRCIESRHGKHAGRRRPLKLGPAELPHQGTVAKACDTAAVSFREYRVPGTA